MKTGTGHQLGGGREGRTSIWEVQGRGEHQSGELGEEDEGVKGGTTSTKEEKRTAKRQYEKRGKPDFNIRGKGEKLTSDWDRKNADVNLEDRSWGKGADVSLGVGRGEADVSLGARKWPGWMVQFLSVTTQHNMAASLTRNTTQSMVLLLMFHCLCCASWTAHRQHSVTSTKMIINYAHPEKHIILPGLSS